MRAELLPHGFHYDDLKRWYVHHHRQLRESEMHGLIAVAALAAVGSISAFLVLSFW